MITDPPSKAGRKRLPQRFNSTSSNQNNNSPMPGETFGTAVLPRLSFPTITQHEWRMQLKKSFRRNEGNAARLDDAQGNKANEKANLRLPCDIYPRLPRV